LFSVFCSAQKGFFPIVTGSQKATIVYSTEGPKLDSIAANLLADDIERVTSFRPTVITDIVNAKGNVIVIGNVQSALVQKFISKQSSVYKNLLNKWECFAYKIIDKPSAKISKSLVITGSDARGAAYGVFTLSEKLGVSPWWWWADVPVKKQRELTINQEDYVSSPPSAKYRGIFINDEDWGLQPWAAKTFEPETGDIGPKTYAKVFELLLRLKANLIWPAMHPSTKAFFHYPGNVKTAGDYQIIIGSSHAEPILRNNVSEWDEKIMGPFNYITNQKRVYHYWEDRVKESNGINAIYTIGMRGVHDSGIEGVKDPKDAVPLLERIFQDQRKLLSNYAHKDATAIPQVFTAYKEVLDIYDQGLKVPDDVTLVWPDDNYGYIQRLSTEEEKKRSGGAGVYYHASYWGRPHDYLWLSTTHPSLIREEMMKAYETGADRLWVLNVGDIKPLEYNIQFFLDMAYDASPFGESSYTKKHLQAWLGQMFGKEKEHAIAEILWEYYQLAFERRPEFMGWSQTEPTTKTTYTAYNHFNYGDEAQRRLDKYEALEKSVRALKTQVDANEAAAFYQLVYYPVVCASWMNKKFLYRDKAYLYAKQNRVSAYDYAVMAKKAYDSIVNETTYFNEQLRGGKWKGIMSMNPRDLPVYQPPQLPTISIQKGIGWDAVPEGYDTTAQQKKFEKRLPPFLTGTHQTYFLDVFLTDFIPTSWQARPFSAWIKLSSTKGHLQPTQNQSSVRLWVSIDWAKLPPQTLSTGYIEIAANGEKIRIQVQAQQPAATDFHSYKGLVEENGLVSIQAAHFTNKIDKADSRWRLVQGLGHTGASLRTEVNTSEMNERMDTTFIRQHSAQLTYSFYTFSQAVPTLSVYTLPTHPLNKNFGMRYAVCVDDGPIRIIDFRMVGRSEEWKQNVLRNEAIKEIDLPPLKQGRHILVIYAIDPGVVLDRLLLTFGDVPKSYSVVPETWKN
jgi:hypothetical protein